jgi:hypothetical protein
MDMDTMDAAVDIQLGVTAMGAVHLLEVADMAVSVTVLADLL